MFLVLAHLLALAVDPEPNPAALIEAGHFKLARALAQARLQANANDPGALYLMGRVKLAYGDIEGALPLAEKAVAADAKNADYHYLLGMVVGQKAQRAGILSKLGLAKRFKREAETAVALDPKHVDAYAALIEYHLQAPGLAGGDKAAARELAQKLTGIDPPRGYLAQARLAQAEKQTGAVEGFYLRALEADPRRYNTRLALAAYNAADTKKDYKRAEEHAREALAIDPLRAGGYSALAALFALQARYDELDAILAEAERRVADNFGPHYQAGRVLLTEGKDLARAERSLRKYLTQEPEGGTPTHAHAQWRLGLVLEKQGRRAEAVAALETAVRLRPDLEEAKKDLRRLR